MTYRMDFSACRARLATMAVPAEVGASTPRQTVVLAIRTHGAALAGTCGTIAETATGRRVARVFFNGDGDWYARQVTA